MALSVMCIRPGEFEEVNALSSEGTCLAGMQEYLVPSAFSGQKELFDLVGSKDKTFKRYEGLKHEVYNELPADRAKVLADLHTWLDSHL